MSVWDTAAGSRGACTTASVVVVDPVTVVEVAGAGPAPATVVEVVDEVVDVVDVVEVEDGSAVVVDDVRPWACSAWRPSMAPWCQRRPHRARGP